MGFPQANCMGRRGISLLVEDSSSLLEAEVSSEIMASPPASWGVWPALQSSAAAAAAAAAATATATTGLAGAVEEDEAVDEEDEEEEVEEEDGSLLGLLRALTGVEV